MILPVLTGLTIFFGTIFGLAWPIASRLPFTPAEKLCASGLLSLLLIYLFAFGVYTLGMPMVALWGLPVIALVGLFTGCRSLAFTLLDPDARTLLVGQLLVASWCTCWLFFIVSYSGGGWVGDWFEHWERTRFFLERWQHEMKFIGTYALPARPPLANLVTGAFLAVTRVSFAHFQLVTSLLNCLAFLPAALLVRRFGGGRAAVAVLALLLMVNPSFVENTTFAWTKLLTVFFILSGLYFFLRTLDHDRPQLAGPLCAAALAGGILTHYSAVPFVLLLAVSWAVVHRRRWRETVLPALIGALLLATWFGWSLAIYGPHTTFFSNSTVTSWDPQNNHQLLVTALNLRDTLVPHFLRTFDTSLIAQRSPWGWWRDWFFQLYQVNLLFIFGSVGWLVLGVELARGWWHRRTGVNRWFWPLFAGGGILLGIAAHSGRDHWGLSHICLQTILVLGLTFLAAHWSRLRSPWRFALILGAMVDLVLGIALQFGVQSYALDLWLLPRRDPVDILTSYNKSAIHNLGDKIRDHLSFFPDDFTLKPALVLGLLAALLMLAVARVRTSLPKQ